MQPYRQHLVAVAALHLTALALAAEALLHLRGRIQQGGPNLARHEGHHLGLRGVGLKTNTVKETGQEVHDRLKGLGVAGGNKLDVHVEDGDKRVDLAEGAPHPALKGSPKQTTALQTKT